MTDTPETSRPRWIKWAVIGGVAAIVLVVGGVFVYTNFIGDAPDALDESDLSNALGVTTPVASDTASPETVVPETLAPETAAPGTVVDETVAPNSAAPTGFDGVWAPTDASEFGYRIDEVIAGVNKTAVGRGSDIDGSLTIDGTTATGLDVEVQIETIKSDEGLRDNQFKGRIMNVAEFPTAAFTLTEPIDFGSVPVGEEQVTATATGDLTLKGVMNPVTFEVTAQAVDGRIGVLGSIPIVFADYGIDNPSFGAIRTEDDGLLEFVLVFEPA